MTHIYANQVETQHITNQADAEYRLQHCWEQAQTHITTLLFHLNTMTLIIYAIMISLFYRYFRQHPKKVHMWPVVFLVLTLTQTTLMTTLPRWLGLMNGLTMIRVYKEAQATEDQVVTSHDNPRFTGSDDCSIHLSNISLELGGKQIFLEFNGHINQGEKVLVQGASGSGKSSLFNLLTRYLSGYTGVITVGGVDINDWTITDLRSHIVTIPQQTQLFDKSILYNICVGECSDEQEDAVTSVIQKYGWERILGDDLTKTCGPMGKDVSHGMQKLIILLRLLWKSEDARVILIDEPLASLDQQTQDQVLHFIVDMSKGRTVMINNHVPLTPTQQKMFDQIWDSSSFTRPTLRHGL